MSTFSITNDDDIDDRWAEAVILGVLSGFAAVNNSYTTPIIGPALPFAIAAQTGVRQTHILRTVETLIETLHSIRTKVALTSRPHFLWVLFWC